MSDTSFVRTEMLEEQAPPLTTVGLIGWLRENLFSGWVNTVLTVVSLGLIWYVLSGILPWVFQSVWRADSLGECREIMLATWGETHGHACWAVIADRWKQLLFGFYPSDLYWRPILAFVLLLASIAPVLFAERVPRQLIYLTAAYPFIMPWLMWGGTIWNPVMAAAGFVVGFFAMRYADKAFGSLAGLIAGAAAAVIWWLFLMGPVAGGFASVLPLALEPVGSRLFGGFMLSILIGVVAIGASLPIGIVLALGRQSDLLIVKSI